MKKIRVLVVDDSALVRKILTQGLNNHPNIEVIGSAHDPYKARDILVELQPDVITLDIEMPKMDGVMFLRKFMPVMPTPTVVISSLTGQGKKTTIQALEAGAIEAIEKPSLGIKDNLNSMMEDVCQAVINASKVNVKRKWLSNSSTIPKTVTVAPLEQSTDKIIAIGASTGGVEALARILPMFPAASPGIIIVQHMPAYFTKSFAERLDTLSAMKVKEAEDGDRVRNGLVLIAPGGDSQLHVIRSGGNYLVKLIPGEKVSRHCPSIDVMFDSLAKSAGKNVSAVLMTGMGKDGASGLLKIKEANGRTFVQDEETSVVYGMPKEAFKLQAAEIQLSLSDIPETLLKSLKN